MTEKQEIDAIVVDAHEDIAVNAFQYGRDVRKSALVTRREEIGTGVPAENGLCMVGLPEWLEGRVALVCGTLYAAPATRRRSGTGVYRNAEEAHRLGRQQLDLYHRLEDEEERITLVRDRSDLDAVVSSWESNEPRVGLLLLMEGADPIREPAEAEMWYEEGVRAVGLSWITASRYAGGNGEQGPLTDEGRDLLAVMASLGMILDVSHLAEDAFFEALDRYEGVVFASHANPRARVPGPRQLSDTMIRRLLERNGVIGVVPYNSFLKPDWSKGGPKQAVTLDDMVAAIDHICQISGDAQHVGIGSDFDGGFGAESTPVGIDTVADLRKVGVALGDFGYGQESVQRILSGNWLRLFSAELPG